MSIPPETVSPPPGLTPLEGGDPASIGPYRVVGRLGSGGMGVVYGAQDVYGLCVAVKTVHADLARRPRFREAFAREIEMLDRANGLSTARLHAADTEAEVPWLAFDYVPGRDLRGHVREFGPLEGGMLRAFALGAAEGLAALHAAGIAHRDIKPGNVILSPEGPKIVDLGIAVEIGTDRAEDGSASYGTPGWTAPERYSGAASDPAADVFAWGGLVVLAATGRQPFGSGEAAELARRVCEGEFDAAGVPKDLRGLVEAALSVDPDRRPDSEGLVRALLPVPESGPGGEPGRPQTTADSLRRMLRDYWRGVDDAGHDPARWASAVGAVSAAGLGASALGSGVMGSGAVGSVSAAAGAGAAESGAAGTVLASASEAPAMVAGGGTGGTGAATGGTLKGIATSKVTMAGAGLLVAAGVTAGGFVAYDQVAENPSEAVAAAVGLLEERQSYTARVERTFSEPRARQVAESTGTPVDQVLEDNLSEEEYLYSAEEQVFLIEGEGMGRGTAAVANRQGDLYVYAPRPSGAEGWWPRTDRLEVDESVSADTVSAALVTAPLRALADTDQVETEAAGVYTGSTALGFLDEGSFAEVDAVGRIELDEAGEVRQVEYTSERWDVRVEFEELDVEALTEDPQVWDIDDGRGWMVVHAPICGTIAAGEPFQVEWDVQASGWDMDCDYAMDIAEVMADPDNHQDRQVQLWGDFPGGATRAIDEAVFCGENYLDEETYPLEHGVSFDICGPISELTEPENPGSTRASGYHDAETEDETLIEFHERD